ncbi:hypothetical protein Hanom_Chr16g01498131 [Helianthus anomalus]
MLSSPTAAFTAATPPPFISAFIRSLLVLLFLFLRKECSHFVGFISLYYH